MFDPSSLTLVSNESVEGRLVLSASQLDSYLKCPHLYKMSYTGPRKKRVGRGRYVRSSVMLGAIVHQVIERMNKFAIDNSKYPEWDTVKADFADTWMRVSEAYTQGVRLRYLDMGKSLIYKYYTELTPVITPLAVEQRFLMEVEGIPVSGCIDLITTKGDILDFKTRFRAPKGDEARTSLQLSVYSLAYRALYDKWPKSARLLFFHRVPTLGLTLLPGARDMGRRSAGQLSTTVDLLKHVYRMVSEQNFTPIPGTSCGRCKLKRTCPALN